MEESKDKIISDLQSEIAELKKQFSHKSYYNSEVELFEIINKSTAIVFSWSSNEYRTIEFVSNNITSFGYESEEVYRNRINYIDFIVKSDRQRVLKQIQDAISNKLSDFALEYQIISKNGDNIWIEEKSSIKYYPNGEIKIHGMIFDVTTKKMDSLLKDVLYRISGSINESVQLGDLLEKIKNILNEVIDTTNFYIAFYNKQTNTISLPYVVDEKDDILEFPAEGSLTYYIIQNDMALLADTNVLNELEKNGDIELVGAPSNFWMGVPLKIGDEIIGAVAVQSYDDKIAYTKHHLEVLRFVSDQIAIAIRQKQAVENLRINEAKYRLIVENSPFGILHFDNRGIITACNEAHSRIIGTKKEDLIGFNMILDLDDEIVKNKIISTLNGERISYEGKYTSTTGNKQTFVRIEFAPLFSEDGIVESGIAIVEDITERKKSQETLEDREEKLQAIFNNALAGISIIDFEGNYQYFNDRWANMLGYAPIELKNMKFQDVTFIDDIEKSKSRMSELKKSKIDEIYIEKRYVRKNGSIFWGGLSVSRVHDKDGKVDAILSIIIDISRSKNAESQIIEFNRQLKNLNATKDKFFSIIAHDLRNNLGSFRDMSKELTDKFESFDKNEIMETLTLLSTSSTKVYSLLENLLEWARSQTGDIPYNPELFSLTLSVQNIAGLLYNLAHGKNIKITVVIDDNLYVFADHNMFSTIVRNLISNAIKFTRLNGEIQVSGEVKDGMALICIEDNGVGIHPDNINKLFKIDHNITTLGTSNEHGTGLGLILCQEFVEKNKGKIWVESEIDKGTKFKFTVPLQN